VAVDVRYRLRLPHVLALRHTVNAESIELSNTNLNIATTTTTTTGSSPNQKVQKKKKRADEEKVQSESGFVEVGNVNGLSNITFEFGLSKKGMYMHLLTSHLSLLFSRRLSFPLFWL
jgi:hypothetical protein